ncbi:EF-hand domain-containing family member C2-like isoform X2 [Lycorma delicatula]|uniref:EF-hand domain-containing family member C2-like isoform X2 n=1 Tax=Lycorma delicatula TaxID=130591 RepID=UPI003F515E67
MLGKSLFHKSHHFELTEVPCLSDKERPGISGVPLPGSSFSRYPSLYAKGDSPELPPWITYDRQVLKFDAYFQEMIPEVAGYNHIIRKCIIYFFLEDGTIKVVEPIVKNSGIAQGCLMSRQRIRLPNASACRIDEFYDVIDLNIGRNVEFHGRVFKITNCDHFTRNFLNRLGIPVPDPIETPADPYTEKRAYKMKLETLPRKPAIKKPDFSKFIEMDRKVLSFSAYWDDRETHCGELHLLQVRFYLADNTIEVKDVTDKDNNFLLIHRAKLPKEFKGLPGPGAEDAITLLNVFGPERVLADPKGPLKGKKNEFYLDSDLMIGAVIYVYGRKVVLIDCDQFTKEYYRIKYGIDEFTPIKRPPTNDETAQKAAKRSPPELPPYNGFGTHEDSAINCRTVFPTSITKSYKQFYEKDRIGYDSNILRYLAELVSNRPNDKLRSFIISYYLSDDTLSVFETAEINSGYNSGMRVSRRQISKPGEQVFGCKPPACYSALDFYVGNELVIETFKYLLIDADEYALKYMELRANEFPKSNVKLILDKVKNKLKPCYKEFVSRHLVNDTIPVLTYRQFRESIKSILCDEITEHEIITLARYYSSEVKVDPLPNEYLRSIIQCELKKNLFNSFERLEESFRYRDINGNGKVKKDAAYSVLRGAKLPLDVEVINYFLNKMCTDEEGKISYKDLLDFIDYKKNPAPNTPPINVPNMISLVEKENTSRSRNIEFVLLEKLLKDTELENELIQQSS